MMEAFDRFNSSSSEPSSTMRIKPIVPKMGNTEGVFRTQIDYQERTGSGNHLPRPDNLNFGYSFMKRGYLPAKVEFTLPKNQNRAQAC